MNTIVWFFALVLLGIGAGRIVGARLAFTGGRTRHDLAAGLVGAVLVAVPMRMFDLSGYSASLPTLIIGVSAAMLATWLRRIATWRAEPRLPPENEPAWEGRLHLSRDLMTTAEGTRVLLSGGKLVAPSLTEPPPPTADPA
jgi:hypothetical protein